MQNRFAVFVTAAAMAAPTLALAQPEVQAVRRVERIKVEPRVALQVQQRQRPLPRPRPQPNDGRMEQRERLDRTFRIGGTGELQLTNVAGDITINRGGGGEVRVEAVKVARARTDQEAREILSRVRVEFTERGNRAEAKAVYPDHSHMPSARRGMSNVSVEYTVTAPEGTRVTVTTITGDVRVQDIRGDLALSSTTGDVEVHNAARLISAKSTVGDIRVINLRSEIALTLENIDGDITLRDSRAPRIHASTVAGNLRLSNVEVERLDAQTTAGDIEITTALARNGRYDLNSHAGTITIGVLGGVGFELDASSFAGNIRSDLPLKNEEQGVADLSRRNPRSGRTRALRGVYGDGSASLDITTFSGSVVITKK